jgi:hypothetical protein
MGYSIDRWCDVDGEVGRTKQLVIALREPGGRLVVFHNGPDLCDKTDCLTAALHREAERLENRK